MNTPSKIKSVALALVASVVACGSSFAQSSTTPTIGYYKQAFEQAGAYPVVCGFVARTDFQGQATSTGVAGTVLTVTQTGAGWTDDAFNTAGAGKSSHYIEVLSAGSNLGLILDITDNDATTLTVDVPAGFVPGANFTYAVRKHATLGSIYGTSSGLEADSDSAILFTPAGTEITALFGAGGTWSDANDLSDLTNYVIYPGTGLVLYPADARTVTVGGGDISYVKSGPTKVSLSEGIPTLVGLINPLVSSGPSDPIHNTTGRNTLSQAGFDGIQPDADSITLITADGNFGSLMDSFYDSGSSALVNANTLAPIGTTTYLMNGTSVVYFPSSDFSFTLPQRH